MAKRVQPGAAAQLTGLPAAGARRGRVAPRAHSTRDADNDGWTNIGSGTNIRGGSVAIMFGLLFATGLTLGVVPILYSLFFRVSFRDFSS